MRAVAKSWIFADEVGQRVFEALKRIYPKGDKGHYLDIALNEDDNILKLLLKILSDNGFSPRCRMQEKTPDTFSYRLEREYNVKDWMEALLLVPQPLQFFSEYAYRSDIGNIQLEEYQAKPIGHVGNAGNVGIIVTDNFRKSMEDADLKHIFFREIGIKDKPGNTFKGHWELTSDLTLPPLSKTCKLMKNDGELFDGDYEKGCFLVEGHYTPAELHYAEKDIKKNGPFDLGMTRERFGNMHNSSVNWPVASKRFYDFCVKEKLKMKWIPVRIDT